MFLDNSVGGYYYYIMKFEFLNLANVTSVLLLLLFLFLVWLVFF